MSFIESRDSVLAPMAAGMPGLAIGSDASLAMLAAEAAPGATAGASATPRAAPSEPRKPGAARVEVPAAAKPAATVDMQSVQRGVVFPAKDSTATVAHAGKPVSREALFEWVWPDTLPTDDVLTQAVTQLRKAFADDRERPRYIEAFLGSIAWNVVERRLMPAAGGAAGQRP